MEQLRRWVTHLLDILTGTCFLVMVGLTFWQVIMRYLFHTPLTWSEELVGYLFAWASLLGACLVTGERGHMNIPVICQKMPETVQKWLGIFGEVIAFLFSVVILVYGGVEITQLSMGQMTASLGVPIGVFYVFLPVAGVLNALYTILNIIAIAEGKTKAFVED